MQKIGMRNVKTAISVFLCMIILNAFQNTSPFFACIAAVITMQGTVHSSFTSGKSRMVGTIIGATLGLILALINPSNIFLTSIGIIFVIYFLCTLDEKDSISIACVVFLAIMINVNQHSALTYSFKRVIETFMGISIAVLVNYLISPPKYLDKLQKHSNVLIGNIFVISKDVFNLNSNVNLSSIDAQISKLQKSLDLYTSEIRRGYTKEQHILKVNKVIDTSKVAYNHLTLLTTLTLLTPPSNLNFNKTNCDKINELFSENTLSNSYISSDLNIVFNFHIESLLKTLTILTTF